MSISAIAGLGNPGPRYEKTRHNVGFMVVNALAERFSGSWKPAGQGIKAEVCPVEIDGNRVDLIKPLDYMNNSGKVLGAWSRYYQNPVSRMAVIYDDINLDPVRAKISVGGSDGGHNGVTDLLQHLGSDFVRFRIGIGPKAHPEMSLIDFVLGKFPPDHVTLLENKMPELIEGLISLVKTGPVLTMNHFNQRKPPDERSK
jgi:PTH1 family peptidyl-tRNA hydrolase